MILYRHLKCIFCTTQIQVGFSFYWLSFFQKRSDNGFQRGSSGRASPPRGISGILNTASYTENFRRYLNAIDEEKDDDTEVTRLDFIIKCRRLYDDLGAGAGPSEVNKCIELHDEFFVRRRVALENTVLRDELAKQLKTVKTSNQISNAAELRNKACQATKDAELKLDGLHQTFLRRHKKDQQACLL